LQLALLLPWLELVLPLLALRSLMSRTPKWRLV
jgi:hypothetical protein